MIDFHTNHEIITNTCVALYNHEDKQRIIEKRVKLKSLINERVDCQIRASEF